MSSGNTAQLACKEASISEQSYYRWRTEYGGLQHGQAKRFKELERENARLRKLVADLSLEKAMLRWSPREAGEPRATPTRRGHAAGPVGVSGRRACRIVPQSRAVQRYVPTVRADEDALTQAIIALATEYGCYGYRLPAPAAYRPTPRAAQQASTIK